MLEVLLENFGPGDYIFWFLAEMFSSEGLGMLDALNVFGGMTARPDKTSSLEDASRSVRILVGDF